MGISRGCALESFSHISGFNASFSSISWSIKLAAPDSLISDFLRSSLTQQP